MKFTPCLSLRTFSRNHRILPWLIELPGVSKSHLRHQVWDQGVYTVEVRDCSYSYVKTVLCFRRPYNGNQPPGQIYIQARLQKQGNIPFFQQRRLLISAIHSPGLELVLTLLVASIRKTRYEAYAASKDNVRRLLAIRPYR